MKEVYLFIVEHWVIISSILALILPRLVPTGKNYDLATAILKLLDKLIPNLKKGGGKHTVVNFIIVGVLLLSSVSSFGQTNTSTRIVRFNDVQTAADTSAAAITIGDGYMWYDITTNNFRGKKKNGSKFTFGSGSGGGSASLTSTFVGYGSAGNVLTGEANMNYDAAGNVLTVENIQLGRSSDGGSRLIYALSSDAKEDISIGAKSNGVDKGAVVISSGLLNIPSATLATPIAQGNVENNAGILYISNATERNKVFAGFDGTLSIDFPSTAAQTSNDQTITATGAALGDQVILGVPSVSAVANSCYTAWVSAANTVTIRLNNYSSAAVDPASGTFNVSVVNRN